jgi:hypothetical protein
MVMVGRRAPFVPGRAPAKAPNGTGINAAQRSLEGSMLHNAPKCPTFCENSFWGIQRERRKI